MKLERALNNLLGNAVKFSPPGREGRGDACARGAGATPWVVVEVTDHGPGIDPSAHEAIFDMFHREETTAEAPGVGLGLYITRQIAEAARRHRDGPLQSRDRAPPSRWRCRCRGRRQAETG